MVFDCEVHAVLCGGEIDLLLLEALRYQAAFLFPGQPDPSSQLQIPWCSQDVSGLVDDAVCSNVLNVSVSKSVNRLTLTMRVRLNIELLMNTEVFDVRDPFNGGLASPRQYYYFQGFPASSSAVDGSQHLLAYVWRYAPS